VTPEARLGVDVGGTFTDIALWDEARQRLTVFKLPSVPADPAEGILAGIRAITTRDGVPPATLGFVAHGTTVATNALLEKKGARTALLTTRGFRDLLEIARQKRPDLYDLQADKPVALVPRPWRLEARERLLADGAVRDKLDEADVAVAIDALDAASEPIEALAICFLYSFLDPAHERRAAELVQARRPALYLALSSDVSPEFREYERLSTTVINAYLGPLVGTWEAPRPTWPGSRPASPASPPSARSTAIPCAFRRWRSRASGPVAAASPGWTPGEHSRWGRAVPAPRPGPLATAGAASARR
jgi:N-methylhydantoinase A